MHAGSVKLVAWCVLPRQLPTTDNCIGLNAVLVVSSLPPWREAKQEKRETAQKARIPQVVHSTAHEAFMRRGGPLTAVGCFLPVGGRRRSSVYDKPVHRKARFQPRRNDLGCRGNGVRVSGSTRAVLVVTPRILDFRSRERPHFFFSKSRKAEIKATKRLPCCHAP